MFDTKAHAVLRTAVRLCTFAALTVLPLAATDSAAIAQPTDDSAAGISVGRPHHGNGDWDRGGSDWRRQPPGPSFPGFLPPPWNGPDGFRHGHAPLPPHYCSGSFGSC